MNKKVSVKKAKIILQPGLWLFLSSILLTPALAGAQLRLAEIFSENMVLQRDQPVCIWGKAVPGNMVTVSFAGMKQSSSVNRDSLWSIKLPVQKANPLPQPLTITSGAQKIVIQNILVGDIWLCIGQSNMEWPMSKEIHFKNEIKNSNQPLLRFFNPSYAGKNIFGTAFTDSVVQRLFPDKFYEGEWQQCDSNSFKNMSAVAYYFGKEVANTMDVPIGLINLSIGGAPLETFIDKEVLKNSSQFAAKVNGDWLSNNSLPVWVRERGRQNVGSLNNVPGDENGKDHAYKPGFAYAAGIEPLLPMPVKGILCYQGESNAQEIERVDEYAALSKLMVNDYRKKWNQPNLPFYFVQLSSIDTVKYNGHLWPTFRDEQRKMLQDIPYSGMAVCSDMGAKDDVHPANKKDVGERLARWALNKTYKKDIISSGPLPVKAIYKNGKVIISCEYMAGGLMTSDGLSIRGFSFDGKNETNAIISSSGIIIPVRSKPQFVYYGWEPFSDGNLVNTESLPASTFKLSVKQ